MKGMLCSLLCLAAALSLSAKVLDFQNFERDGKPVLIPAVHDYRAGEGVCKVPDDFTVSVPAGEELIVEQLRQELRRFGSAVIPENKGAFCRFVLTEKGVPAKDDGFVLAVGVSGITVASRAKSGLFYGAQTLRNLLRNAAAPELKCCRITDWPDFDIRAYSLDLRSIPVTMLPEIKRTLDLLGRMRINRVMIGLGEVFPYRNNPFAKRKFTFPAEVLREIVEYCRKRHIEIVPSLQVWSHAAWMTAHPDWDKMKEGDPAGGRMWHSACCPLNEQAREVTRMAIEEQIEFYRCSLFSIAYDEIYLCPFRVCPRCKVLPPEKLLADHLAFVRGILEKRGVRMVVCQDSFLSTPRWPYGDWFRSQLPRDAFINWWSYRDRLDGDKMAPFKDFNLIGSALGGKPFNVHNMAKLLKKYGGNACRITRWYYTRNGLLAKLDQETPDSLGGFVNGADYLWNLRDTAYPYLGYDGAFEAMRMMYPEAVTARPRTGAASPLPLEEAVNAELSGSGVFPRFDSGAQTDELKAALAKLPERFRLVTSPGGKYYAIRLAGSRGAGRYAVRFDFRNCKARELSFLLTASRPWNMMDYHGHTYGKKRFVYEPAAELTVEYEDGDTLVKELKYRRDLTDWNRPFGGTGMRFAVRGVDADKNYYSFGIYDFRNPYPDKRIKFITFTTLRLDRISVALLALSAWGVDAPFALPKRPFDPAVLKHRGGVSREDMGSTVRFAWKFDREDALRDLEFYGSEKLVGALRKEIVADPASPTGGRVLKLTIPPGNYRRRDRDMGYLRLSVAMPYRIARGTKTLVLDCRVVSAAGDFHHCNDYLAGAGERGRRQYRMYPLYCNASWRRMFYSQPYRSECTLKDITRTRRRSLGFFFSRIEHPVEIYIGALGDTAEDISTAPLWREGTEAEPI